jgi:hypothetical protein
MRRPITYLLIGLCLAFTLLKPSVVQGSAVFLAEAATGACASWQATYFDDTRGYNAPPVVRRDDAQIDFDWGSGAPAPGMLADHFSVRWKCTAHFPAGTYRFTATGDDGIRLYVDGQPVVDAWFDHPVRTFTRDISLAEGDHEVIVTYYENTGRAVAKVSWTRAPGPSDGWQGEYFDNRSLSGSPVRIRIDADIDFDWRYGSPAPHIPYNDFSIRWRRTVPLQAGTYRFAATSDDGIRVYVDGRLLIDEWHDHPPRTYTADLSLASGPHDIVVEYYEHKQVAVIAFSWTRVSARPGEWQGEYFANRSLGGAPVLTRSDKAIDFDWGYGSPDASIPSNNFSASWTRTVHFEPDTYRFTTTTDDGVRLWVGDKVLIDQWHDQSARSHSATIYLSGDTLVRMETYEHTGVAVARLWWTRLGDTPAGEVIVDDSDAGFVKGGAAATWHRAGEGYGGHLYWTWNNDRVRANYNWARWYPDLVPGSYQVYVYVPERYSSTSKARYWISHAGGYCLRQVDQSANGGRWVSLGTYRFRGSRRDYVSLADVTFESYLSRLIAFDAVKWVAR